MLGLVCSKTPQMESVDALCARVKEATLDEVRLDILQLYGALDLPALRAR